MQPTRVLSVDSQSFIDVRFQSRLKSGLVAASICYLDILPSFKNTT